MDEAILRPGRMDEQFFFPALGASARWNMFSGDFVGHDNFEQQFKLMTTNLSGAGVKKILDSMNAALVLSEKSKMWKILPPAVKSCIDRDERALFTSADYAAVVREHGTLKSEDLVMPQNGCLAIWGGRDGEWTIEGGGGERKVKLGTFGRVQTQVKAWCAGVALANNAIYVHVLDSKALKDGKFDEEVVNRIFDEAKEMSSLDGSIIFVDVDALVGVQETVDKTFYEWQDNGGKVNSEDDIGTKFERVAVQRVQTVHVGQHLTENSETPYRHEEEVSERSEASELFGRLER